MSVPVARAVGAGSCVFLQFPKRSGWQLEKNFVCFFAVAVLASPAGVTPTARWGHSSRCALLRI